MTKNCFISFIIMLMMYAPCSAEAKPLRVWSGAFKHGNPIPRKHTCDGADLSPYLQWRQEKGAKAYAVTCTDPDAPGGTFIHWVIYNITPNVSALKEGFPRKAKYGIAIQGKNDFGNAGYNGPCPPRGKPHRYFFTVYALDTIIPDAGLSYYEFMKRIKGHVLNEGSIMGICGR